jgi:hypothetical protein
MRELTRADFEGLRAHALREPNRCKPDLLLYEVDGEQVVLKDYSGKAGVLREVVGPVLIGREARALRALRGIEGVPQFRGRPDRHCVAMSYVAGRRVAKRVFRLADNTDFFRVLADIVRQMHARGVVHLDLKHRSNLMVREDGWPAIIDFESALCFGPRRLLGRLAVAVLGQVDLLALENWKRRLCPGALSRRGRRRARLARRLRGWWVPRRFLTAFRDIFVR